MSARSQQVDAEGGAPSIVHLAEAIESKHRVRERLVRALSRAAGLTAGGNCPTDSRPFDPALDEASAPETALELNPLGEYLLNCEIRDRAFIL